MKNVKIISGKTTIVNFEMGASTHKYDGEIDSDKNCQFYYNGEWYMVVYQYHSQNDVVIPCNVYARYITLCNQNNEVFNADFVLINDKPLPQYNGRLKSVFTIC